MKKNAPIELWGPITALMVAFPLLGIFKNIDAILAFGLALIVVANALAILSGIKNSKAHQYGELGSADAGERAHVRRGFYLGEIGGFALFKLFYPDLGISVGFVAASALPCLAGGFIGAMLGLCLFSGREKISRKK